jgi:DNA-directed RNA polymerase subunit RPC12/RpoP
MILFPCKECQTPLRAEEAQAGQLVRCPTCSTAIRVPGGAELGSGGGAKGAIAAARATLKGYNAAAAARASGKRYGFNCSYCSSRLEATEAVAAQEGQCPTCGNEITIPILDRYGRLIDPKTREIIKQDPHPVHAYAAAGDRAPQIVHADGGKLAIKCPRCGSRSPISANGCKSCGMPFTMEGTTAEASGASNGFCVASLVLGIIGIPACSIIILSVLALIFGAIGYAQVSRNGGEGGGKGMAVAGMMCGLIGCALGLITHLR